MEMQSTHETGVLKNGSFFFCKCMFFIGSRNMFENSTLSLACFSIYDFFQIQYIIQ